MIASVEASAAPQPESSSPPSTSSALGEGAKGTALTVVIAIVASIAGIVIIWTIFRKWKLSRSKKFDSRLQPIDWQPTQEDAFSTPAARRRASDTSSFHSGAGHSELRGYGATSEAGHSSDHGHGSLGPLPDHDFTASNVGGYADLARGQPQMAENGVMRGASLNRPVYDTGLPLHHQASYNAPQDFSNYRY